MRMNKEEEAMFERAEMPDEGIIKDNIMTMMNKEGIMNNVMPIMVGSKNPDLKQVPTDSSRTAGMKDVTVVPVLLVNGPEGGAAKVVINTGIMEACGISRRELFGAAYKNLDSKPVVIRSMLDLERVFTEPGGFDALDRLSVDDFTDDEFQMYFVTNDSNFFGAMSIFGNDTVRKIGEKLGDYFIIPSSKHEMIIVKKNAETEAEMVKDMIRQINDNVVDEKDVLSYELYQYDAETGKVITCESGNEADRIRDPGAER